MSVAVYGKEHAFGLCDTTTQRYEICDMPLYFSFIIFKQKWRKNCTTDVVTGKTYVTDN